MKFLEQHTQSSWIKSAIIMEEGDYTLRPESVRGMHVEYIFIPECDIEHYKDSALLHQLEANISCMGINFGRILTYK